MRFKNIKDLKGHTYDFTLESNKLIFAPTDHQEVNLGEDVFVSPGWIDIHVHCNPQSSFLSANPDEIGYQSGVCLVVDAGSLGTSNVDELFLRQKEFKTNIRCFLNISSLGIPGQYELADLKNVDPVYNQKKYGKFVVGYKARISGSVVGDHGVKPLVKFHELKLKDKLPLMVHIGNEPPTFKEIVEQLEPGDILTHVFNGKNENLFCDGVMNPTLNKAIEKRIKLDVGHGTSSFDSKLFKLALMKNPGFKPDFISTDIYNQNIQNEVVKSLPEVMSKIHALGMKWIDILDCVTINPAKHLKLDGFGTIGPETKDLTFFKIVKGSFREKDSKGQVVFVEEKIIPVAVIVQGQFFKLEKEETMDIYKELNLKKVINADGRMTILGVSTFSDEVGNNMKIAGSNYFVMKDLETNVDQEIAKMYGFEAAHIVNSASAGIALGIAAILFKDRVHDVNVQIPDQNEIVLLKGHNVNFGAPIEDLLHLVGANVVEAGYANGCSPEDVIYRITDQTAALMYVVSHHTVQKQILSLEQMIAIAKKYQLPLIVDCASESDLKKYAQKELDLVIFSGAKAFEGPTSGVVFGRKEIVTNITKHQKNIGRAMKVGKENIIGLYTALKKYQEQKVPLDVEDFYNIISKNPYLDTKIVTDNLRPEIQRIKITLNNQAKLNAVELSEQLKNGEVAIYLRDYQATENWLEIDLRSITKQDMEVINQRVNELLGG